MLGGDHECVALEVHPAKASEVNTVVAKKRWAESIVPLAIRVNRWCWIRPPGSSLQFGSGSYHARVLAKAGIEFPAARL